MTPVVLDASAGVKWFRDERGSDAAREVLREHGRGDVTIVVPSLFVYEFVAVAARLLAPDDVDELWRRFLGWRINVREVGDSLLREALAVQRELGCGLYDAVSPALARQLRAPLYTSDRRAHGGLAGTVFLD